MSNLKRGSTRRKSRLRKFIAQVTDEFLRNPVKMGHGLKPEMMITLQNLDRLLFGFKKRSNDQFAILQLLALGCSPIFPVQFPIEIIGVDQFAALEQFGLKAWRLGTETKHRTHHNE